MNNNKNFECGAADRSNSNLHRKSLLNKVAVSLFTVTMYGKGYRFSIVKTQKEQDDADRLWNEEGLHYPGGTHEEMASYQKEIIRFVAYYGNELVGTIALGDPKVLNRPLLLIGADEEGQHFEIRNLVVSKKHRDGAQIVLVGLFKEMYAYSVAHNIKSWISVSTASLYLTMRRYNKQIAMLSKDSFVFKQAFVKDLFDRRFVDTCFTLPVSGCVPWDILKSVAKKKLRKIKLPVFKTIDFPSFLKLRNRQTEAYQKYHWEP